MPNAGRIVPITALPAVSGFPDVNQDFTSLVDMVNDRLRRIDGLIAGAAGAAGGLILDTHAHRVNYNPADYAGYLYWETDRTSLYASIPQAGGRGTSIWRFLCGTPPFFGQPSLPKDLGSNDYGLRVWISVYRHVLFWAGANWVWDGTDLGSGYIELFALPPSVSGWHLCDGSLVTYLKGDGTTATTTLPNLTGHYIKTGAAYAGPGAAGLLGPAIGTAAIGTGAANAASSGHTHTLPADPVANITLMPYFRL